MTAPDPSTPPSKSIPIESVYTDTFGPWLASIGGSLVVTCYQADKIALLSSDGTNVSLHLRDFPRPMGLAVQGQRMAVGTLEEVVLLQNAPGLAPGAFPGEGIQYDALYLPRVSYRVGELAVHGLGFGKAGLWVVNTRFNCLASLSEEYHFVPQWKPPFITDLAPDDRCHMNGLVMIDGEPRFVTCLGTTDTPGGWRAEKLTGGVVLSVPDGKPVIGGLTMPHSPRWYDNRLWVLNSGHGQLGYVNPGKGTLEVVCTLPGYVRGLCFLGSHAVVGMCRIRERHIFGGLPIADKFPELMCGLAVVDLRTGTPIAMFRFTSGCEEIFEIDFLPGVRQGALLNTETSEIHYSYTAPGHHWWNRDQ